jgi:transposase
METSDAELLSTAALSADEACPLSGVELQAEVMRLYYLEKLSIRAISRRLRIARKTVRKCLALEKKAMKRQERHSLLKPYESDIQRWLRETPELLAPQILERLREKGYDGGITILRDLIRKQRPCAPLSPYLVVQHEPGATMQVDWADFGFALSGVPRRVSCFVAMLPFSRMIYAEFTLSQRIGSLLRCMDNAVDYFGGVTTADVFDNMKTVVLERLTGRPPKFNPRFLQYANARGGFAVIACTPRHPEGKGSVERGIGFIRQRFWPGRRFQSLDDLNDQVGKWLLNWANARHVESTGKVPWLVFEHVEQSKLKPAPINPFNTDDMDHDTVNPSCRVRFDRNTYSVPWCFVSQHVLIRADTDVVRVFLGPRCIAEHARDWGIRQDLELESHRTQLEQSRQRKPDQIAGARFGDTGARYFKILAASTRSLKREGVRLICLAELFGAKQTEGAMEQVMKSGHVGADYVEHVLRKQGSSRPRHLIRLGDEALDSIALSEPDLSVYDIRESE